MSADDETFGFGYPDRMYMMQEKTSMVSKHSRCIARHEKYHYSFIIHLSAIRDLHTRQDPPDVYLPSPRLFLLTTISLVFPPLFSIVR